MLTHSCHKFKAILSYLTQRNYNFRQLLQTLVLGEGGPFIF